MDLAFEEKLSKKVNQVEDGLKKQCTRDMQRVDTELLILNTNFTTLSSEHRALKERFKQLGDGEGGDGEYPRRSQQEISSQLGLQVNTMVRTLFSNLGLDSATPQSFQDSLQRMI